ncbi:pentapeptide repeat-containing protein, partial [Nonomuraea sp. NPDC003707]
MVDTRSTPPRRDADLSDARLDRADLTYADLTGANLTNAYLRGTYLGGRVCTVTGSGPLSVVTERDSSCRYMAISPCCV